MSVVTSYQLLRKRATDARPDFEHPALSPTRPGICRARRSDSRHQCPAVCSADARTIAKTARKVTGLVCHESLLQKAVAIRTLRCFMLNIASRRSRKRSCLPEDGRIEKYLKTMEFLGFSVRTTYFKANQNGGRNCYDSRSVDFATEPGHGPTR